MDTHALVNRELSRRTLAVVLHAPLILVKYLNQGKASSRSIAGGVSRFGPTATQGTMKVGVHVGGQCMEISCGQGGQV